MINIDKDTQIFYTTDVFCKYSDEENDFRKICD